MVSGGANVSKDQLVVMRLLMYPLLFGGVYVTREFPQIVHLYFFATALSILVQGLLIRFTPLGTWSGMRQEEPKAEAVQQNVTQTRPRFRVRKGGKK